MILATKTNAQQNDLYRIASGGGLILSLFLFAGSFGHLTAILPSLLGVRAAVDPDWLLLLLPAVALAAACLSNALLVVPLWRRRDYAARLSLSVNLAATAYFAYLLASGVPDHPIGVFLTLIGCQLTVLLAIAMGLCWSAK